MDQKPRGSVMLHGHSHGKQDEYFDELIDKVRQDCANL